MSAFNSLDQHRTPTEPASGPARRRSNASGVAEGSGGELSLGAYMRDVSRHPLMTPVEERQRAEEIVRLREAYWRQLMAYPPYVEAIAELVRHELTIERPDPPLSEAANAAANAAVAVRERDRKGTRDALDLSVRELAALLGL